MVVRASKLLALPRHARGRPTVRELAVIGMYTDAGNLTQRRSTPIRAGWAANPEWTVSWPANRDHVQRLLCDGADDLGSHQESDAWNGQRWVGGRARLWVWRAHRSQCLGFMMLPEGRRAFPSQEVCGWSWSEHYEPAESPAPMRVHPSQNSNPALRPFSTHSTVLARLTSIPSCAPRTG